MRSLTANSNLQTMSAESISPLVIADRALKLFTLGLTSGVWEEFIDMMTEDVTFWFPAGPFQGINVGKSRAREFFASVARVFPEGLTITVQGVTHQDSTVVFEILSQGLMLGKPYQNQAAIAFDVKGDKISSYREYLGVIFQLEPP
jgi:ketosteroid isomerase-like protein